MPDTDLSMSNVPGNLNPATAETPATAEPEKTAEKKFTLDSVAKRYFSPAQLATDGRNYVAQIMAITPAVKVTRNFNPEETFPEGYGLAILPIAKRQEGKEGNKTIGVCVAAIPDPSLIVTHEKGEPFVRSVIVDYLCSKVANAVRPRPDGSTASTIPFEIEAFLENRRGRESIKTFTEIAPTFVRALRKMGLKFMTAAILRMTLQSTAFASAQFTKIDQENWVKCLNAMVAKANEKGLDPAILINWKETRDSRSMAEVDEMDFDGLDELE